MHCRQDSFECFLVSLMSTPTLWYETPDTARPFLGPAVSKYFERGCKVVGKPFTLYLEDTCPSKK